MSAPILDVVERDQALIISPQSDLGEIEYEQIHHEAAAVLRQFESSSIRNVIIDFGKTDYFGSSALGFFVRLWRRVREKNGRLVLCHLSEHGLEILRATQLDRVWTLVRSMEEANQLIEGKSGEAGG